MASKTTKDSSINNKGESDDIQTVVNIFANDGSFLDYVKAQEEEKGKQKRTEEPLPVEKVRTVDKVTVVGKRRSLLKTNELREKRRKRMEAQEEKESSLKGKTNAWKSYMAEVKDYESKACTDKDSHKRPLVK